MAVPALVIPTFTAAVYMYIHVYLMFSFGFHRCTCIHYQAATSRWRTVHLEATPALTKNDSSSGERSRVSVLLCIVYVNKCGTVTFEHSVHVKPSRGESVSDADAVSGGRFSVTNDAA